MNINPQKICEICKAPSLYCCPGCSIRTCSLSCVKAHKVSTGCTGERDKTAFVPLDKFSNSELLSDYRFLEEAGRIINEAQRCEKNMGFFKHFPKHLSKLKQAAWQRDIDLRIMPYMFSKRKSNTTMFHYTSKVILWKIEWVFCDANMTFSDERLNESLTINECLDKYLMPESPESYAELAFYQSAGHKGISVLMKKEGSPSNTERYFELDKNKTLKHNFCGKTIVEHPVLLVVLSSSLPCYELVVKEHHIKEEKEDSAVVEMMESSSVSNDHHT